MCGSRFAASMAQSAEIMVAGDSFDTRADSLDPTSGIDIASEAEWWRKIAMIHRQNAPDVQEGGSAITMRPPKNGLAARYHASGSGLLRSSGWDRSSNYVNISLSPNHSAGALSWPPVVMTLIVQLRRPRCPDAAMAIVVIDASYAV